ncbi:hypothetical protein QWA68_003843 [Fusarium oxysporum]|nr:hypothetical protein QWA68_003843 [Fusarium oxysporum]
MAVAKCSNNHQNHGKEIDNSRYCQCSKQQCTDDLEADGMDERRTNNEGKMHDPMFRSIALNRDLTLPTTISALPNGDKTPVVLGVLKLLCQLRSPI